MTADAIVFINEEGIIQMELRIEERTLVADALREHVANLSGFLGKVGTMRGAEAVARLEGRIRKIKDLADLFDCRGGRHSHYLKELA